MVELDHAIGFSGHISNSVFLHPNSSDYICVAGSSVVASNLNDPHSQHFLTAHDDLITCVCVSNSGLLIASGKLDLYLIIVRPTRRQLGCRSLGLQLKEGHIPLV